MKTTIRMTVLVSALGLLSGLATAQEQGATTGSELTATVRADNGAMPGDLHVRIVRLSEVRGMLALDRQTGQGFEQTMQNMPIVQGERLQTGDGFAEVEFEDNTTLRLAPNTRVEFPLLALRATGAKASTINVVRGTVYVNTESTKGNEFMVVAGGAKMMVAPSTHLRLEFGGDKTVLSVFSGSVQAQRDGETTLVSKKESLTVNGDQVDVAKKISEEQYDGWDKESNDYHTRYSNANAFAGGGNSFGLSDLNYYGSFTNAGGCGQMWQPYLVSSSWSPYANGVWALYPGAGYSWVSPYPWGWLPYHTGSWGFCQGVGWGWYPGGGWNGLNNVARTATYGVPPGGGLVAKGTVHSPLRPATMPTPPSAGGARTSLVLSNQSPIVFSKEDKPGNFVFQKDSAGLGVPRGSLGSLNKISSEVGRHGSANMEVFGAPAGGEAFHGSAANRGPVTLRPGSAADNAAWHGNESAAAMAARQTTYGANQGAAAPASRGGGFSQPGSMSGGAPAGGGSSGGGSGGGAKGSAASPK